MRRWIGWTLALLIVAGALVALVGGAGRTDRAAKGAGDVGDGGAASAPVSPAGPDVASPAPAVTGGRDASGSVAAEPAPPGAAVPAARAKVVTRAALTLEVPRRKLDERYAAARDVASVLGGFVEQSEAGGGSASITLRVPAGALDEALTRLRPLGVVSAQSDRGEDVTGQYVDLDARIRNLSAQETVVRDLMGRARSIEETLTIQQRLGTLQEQIEQLGAQRKLLDDQATFATIVVTMHRSGAAPVEPAPRGTLAAAWHDAWNVSVAIVAGCVVVLGAVVPLALLGGLGALVWLGVRRRRPGVRAAGT